MMIFRNMLKVFLKKCSPVHPVVLVRNTHFLFHTLQMFVLTSLFMFVFMHSNEMTSINNHNLMIIINIRFNLYL